MSSRAWTPWVLSTLLMASGARAHGRPPYVERVAFDPRDPDRVVAQFSFGLVASGDAGASWRWVCAAAYDVDATWEDPDIVTAADGSVVIGGFLGAMRGAPDLCGFEHVGGSVDDTFVLDLTGSGGTLWAATSRGGGDPDRVQRSTDEGRTWEILGAPIEGLLSTIVAAPSDASRVYATTVVPATDALPRQTFVLRSDDGGASFAAIPLPVELGEVAPRVVGVDPDDPDRVFVRVARDAGELTPERLLVSDDGAMTFALAIELPQARGFAITSSTVWAGSALGGLWRGDASALDFARVSDLHVRCLEARGDEVWICVDETREGFSLGRSLDGGETVEPLLELRTIRELPACPSCAGTALTCPYWQDDLSRDFATYYDAGFDAGIGADADAAVPLECTDAGSLDAGVRDAGRDAAEAPDAGAGASPGCGCRAATEAGPKGPALLLVLWALLPRRRGRR